MKVGQLIEVLKMHDPELEIVIDGYEEGFAEPAYALPVYIKRHGEGREDGIYGRHGRVTYNALDPTSPSLPPGLKGRIMRPDMKAFYIGEGRHIGKDRDEWGRDD